MNYLAHAYCSYQHPPIIVGNLISDFIKGKKQYDYPDDIQQGIRLHRKIDMFTDSHPAVAEAKKVFRPYYRLYAGAFVDVAFDYFIANDGQLFPTENDLSAFTGIVYHALEIHEASIPPAAIGYFGRMRQQNWLFNYRYIWGIQKSFGGIVYRSQHLVDSDTAAMLFEANIFTLKYCYDAFMPELLKFVEAEKPDNL
jgi:acyl carrier protein phosphodiesterase